MKRQGIEPQDLAAYIFLAIAWGLSFLVILLVIDAFGWIGAVTLRALIAGVTLFIVAALMRRKLDFSAGWWPFFVMGATTVAGQLIGLSYGTPRIGTATAAILVAAIPLFSMLIGQYWGLERITTHGVLGLVLGIVGIVLLVGFPAVPVTGDFLIGCAASLFSSFCAAYGSNYANFRLRGTGSMEITASSFLFGGLMTLPLLVVVPVPALPRSIDYAMLLLLGSIMSGLTYLIYFRLVARVGATKAVSVEFAVTIVAVFVGAILLHEPLSLIQLAGAAIIIAGCALVLGLVPWRRTEARAA